MAKPFQFCLRTLLLAAVPIGIIALPVGWYLRRPKPPQPVTGTVTGTITLDGLPLGSAAVFFVPVVGSGGRPARGITDVFGVFGLETHVTGTSRFMAGAMPGSYKVSVEKVKITPSNRPYRDPRTGNEITAENWIGMVISDDVVDRISPDKYASSDTSDLTADVTLDGANVLTFHLTTP